MKVTRRVAGVATVRSCVEELYFDYCVLLNELFDAERATAHQKWTPLLE